MGGGQCFLPLTDSCLCNWLSTTESGLVESGSDEVKDHHGVFQRKASQRKCCRGCGEGLAGVKQHSIHCLVCLDCEGELLDSRATEVGRD